MLNFRLFISLLISLMLAACGGGVGRDIGMGDTLASADAIAMLSKVETINAVSLVRIVERCGRDYECEQAKFEYIIACY